MCSTWYNGSASNQALSPLFCIVYKLFQASKQVAFPASAMG